MNATFHTLDADAKKMTVPDDVLDRTMIDDLRELNEIGDSDLASEMIQIFLEDAPNRLKNLATGIAESDAERIRQASHSIKGSALQLGANRLALVSAEIENAAKAGELVNMKSLHESFLAEFWVAREALQAEIRIPAA